MPTLLERTAGGTWGIPLVLITPGHGVRLPVPVKGNLDAAHLNPQKSLAGCEMSLKSWPINTFFNSVVIIGSDFFLLFPLSKFGSEN